MDRQVTGTDSLTTTRRACPICNDDQAEVLHSQRFALFDGHHVPDSYDVVSCSRCGAAFADTPVDQRSYDELYVNLSRYAAGPAAHATYSEQDLARFREVALEVSRAVPDRLARVVDIGCANGQLLAAFAELGYTRLCGIDPSPACVREAATIAGVVALTGSLSDMPEGAGPFDVVVLSHVLEHVRDLRGALHGLKAFLHDGSVLYAEVPDAMRYADFAWSPFQDFNTEHINHFSLVSLRNLLGLSGLRTLRTDAKEILSAPGMPYPAIFCVAVLDAKSDSLVEQDLTLKESLRSYVRTSRDLMLDIDARMRAALNGHPRVVVWGTGELTAKLLVDTELARANVVAFVDSNPINQGRVLRGRPVVSPRELKAGGDEVIVVASILHQKSIVRAIRELGLQNRVLGLVAESASL